MDESTSPQKNQWATPIVLVLLTFASTLYVGAQMSGHQVTHVSDLRFGWTFSVPLMAILLAHEFGHFIAGKRHGVDISPPYFIPMPLFLLGTMGAVIHMRDRIRTKNALLDIGAAGPLAGLAIALPVLIYGIATSPIQRIPHSGDGYLQEGRSLLYLGLLHILKGDIPDGHDIMLTPTAFAGWAGMLVTMINLIPVGQLDGGHVAYALLGERQDRVSKILRYTLPFVGIAVCAFYGGLAYSHGLRGASLQNEATAGIQWIVWAGLLWLMARGTGANHPPTLPEPLSETRKKVAIFTLGIFVLLFMPSWARAI